ncbi:MAG: ATP-binding cassette domain-containing protein, partial [Candidatus Roizmanbacteria bacterium]|nr:ATP-binding cassette domain-containing protein [Candidatus Roizmanbacteria bacterium]
VLQGVSLSLYRNERVALLGKNGAGKSTLIKILVGLQQPDSGEVIRDESLSLGYYSQEFESFDLEQTLIDSLYAETSGGDSLIRPLLARFLFTGTKVFNRIKTLSGGEKTRLAIARLLLKNYNLLVLDEPTTYLDPLSQRVILEALKNYTGGILVVSHTAQFLHELAPSRALLLPEQQISTWNASLLSHIGEL